MIIKDDRTDKEKIIHNWLVIGTDKYMQRIKLMIRQAETKIKTGVL